jgi:hypothetical protein
MRNFIIASALTLGLLGGALPANAEPGGCLKYGAGGAVAGHLAHHHGVLGAIAGCGTGMYVRHKYRKNQKLLQQQQGYQNNP